MICRLTSTYPTKLQKYHYIHYGFKSNVNKMEELRSYLSLKDFLETY